jgi:hypothetical protein
LTTKRKRTVRDLIEDESTTKYKKVEREDAEAQYVEEEPFDKDDPLYSEILRPGEEFSDEEDYSYTEERMSNGALSVSGS